MREIKLRAWHKNNKKMFHVHTINFVERKMLIANDHEAIIDVNFDEIELMQYTSKNDKNDKEIYEGDILRLNNEYLYVVTWNKESGCFLLVDQGKGYKIDMNLNFNPKDVEVIGNIYENPELLEVSE